MLPRPILPRFARSSFPFPSPSDSCNAGYDLNYPSPRGGKFGTNRPTKQDLVSLSDSFQNFRPAAQSVFWKLAPGLPRPRVSSRSQRYRNQNTCSSKQWTRTNRRNLCGTEYSGKILVHTDAISGNKLTNSAN